MFNRHAFFWAWVIIALLLRLPYVLGDHFVLDGDEAIIGLMAAEALQGHWQPIFWGQNYGFVLPELISVVPFVAVFGLSAFTVKLPMLLWFILGAWAIQATVAHYVKTRAWHLFVLLLLLAPTWLLWSMRLRGGYLPAFALAHLVIYWAVVWENLDLKRSLLIGLLLGFVFVLQAIWFPGAAGFVTIAWWIKSKQWKHAAAIAISMVVPFLALMPFQVSDPFHQPQFFVFDTEVLSFNASIYLSYLERGIQGLHLHGYAFRSLLSANLFSIAFLLLTSFVLSFAIVRVRNWKTELVVVSAWMACISLLIWSFCLGSAAPRYVLPLFGYVIILLAGLWHRLNTMVVGIVLMILILFGAQTFVRSNEVIYEDFTRSDVVALVEMFEAREIELVFTENPLLQWQILFYSKGEVLARSKGTFDRRPERMPRAKSIYETSPDRTAFVIWTREATFKPDWSNNSFSVDLAPDRPSLEAYGIRDF